MPAYERHLGKRILFYFFVNALMYLRIDQLDTLLWPV